MSRNFVIASLVACIAAFACGYRLGIRSEKADQADRQEVVVQAVEAANLASAHAISQIKVNNTTIKQEVERETHTNTLYVACHHADSGLQLINAALANTGPKSARASELPTPGPSAR